MIELVPLFDARVTLAPAMGWPVAASVTIPAMEPPCGVRARFTVTVSDAMATALVEFALYPALEAVTE